MYTDIDYMEEFAESGEIKVCVLLRDARVIGE